MNSKKSMMQGRDEKEEADTEHFPIAVTKRTATRKTKGAATHDFR